MDQGGVFSQKCQLSLLAILLGTWILCQGATAMINPAAAYCAGLNYTYTISTGSDGGQLGKCVLPNNQAVDAWQFLQGRIGQEYSYCARQNYTLLTVTDTDQCASIFSSNCALCVLPDGKTVEVTKVMNLSLREPNLVIEPPTCINDTCSVQPSTIVVPTTTAKSPLSLAGIVLALSTIFLLLKRRK